MEEKTMSSKGPFMEWMRLRAATITNDTYREQEWETPTSKTEKMAMLIHKIQFHIDDITGMANDDEIDVDLHDRAGQVEVLNYDDSGLIEKMNYFLKLTTSGAEEVGMIREINYSPPILYAKKKMYSGINSAGMGALTGCDVRIGYTLEKVSQENFIAALVED